MPDNAQAEAAAQYHEEEQRREQRRLAAEESAQWRRQREEQEELTQRTRKDAMAAARQAANVPQRSATMDYGYSRPQYGSSNTIVASDGSRHQQQQEEMRKREEEITRRRAEAKRLQEQEAIGQRQHEAENAARAARQGLVGPSPVRQAAFPQQTAPSSHLYQQAPPWTINYSQQRQQAPTSSPVNYSQQQQQQKQPLSAINYPQQQEQAPLSTISFSQRQQQKHSPSTINYPSAGPSSTAHAQPRPVSWFDAPRIDAPRIMPLENPTYEGDSTDSESVQNLEHDFRRLGKQKQALTPGRAPVRRYVLCVVALFSLPINFVSSVLHIPHQKPPHRHRPSKVGEYTTHSSCLNTRRGRRSYALKMRRNRHLMSL